MGRLRYLPERSSSGLLPLAGDGTCASSRTWRLAAMLALWYISSLLTSLSTKAILRDFPYPITLAAVQQALAAALGWASLLRDGSQRMSLLRDRHLHRSTLPVASVMVITLASYRWALMMSSVSFVHTVKTLGPVFTIAFSHALLGERLPATRCLSVCPVILGVALTSITEAEFAMSGMLAILLSTAGQALQSVLAKGLLMERHVGKAEFFAMAALHAFAMLLPLSLALDAWRIRRHPLPPAHTARILRWLVLNGVCSYVNRTPAPACQSKLVPAQPVALISRPSHPRRVLWAERARCDELSALARRRERDEASERHHRGDGVPGQACDAAARVRRGALRLRCRRLPAPRHVRQLERHLRAVRARATAAKRMCSSARRSVQGRWVAGRSRDNPVGQQLVYVVEPEWLTIPHTSTARATEVRGGHMCMYDILLYSSATGALCGGRASASPVGASVDRARRPRVRGRVGCRGAAERAKKWTREPELRFR